MPSIFTPTPAETERKEPGFGGKPPVDRRPTGGGGGGGDDDWKPQHRGPREALYKTRAFVFCALAGDMMFFVILVALFYARQAGTHMDPRTLRQIGGAGSATGRLRTDAQACDCPQPARSGVCAIRSAILGPVAAEPIRSAGRLCDAEHSA